jgi:hypothetical protein
LSKGKNIVKWIKGQRMGHLERMEKDRMPKNVFTQEMEGTRRRGGPRKGWREEVERDLQVLGVRRWRDLVIDRENGEVFFDRPKPTAGCSANGRRRKSQTNVPSHELVLWFNRRRLKKWGCFAQTFVVVL